MKITQTKLWLLLALFAVGAILVRALTDGKDLDVQAAIWGAYGTAAAAVAALVIAIESSQRSTFADSRRAAAAAILVSHNLHQLRAILSVVHESESLVKSNTIGYGGWLSMISANIAALPPIVEDKHLPWVAELDGKDLFPLITANTWLERFKKNTAFPPGVTLATVVERFDSVYDELNWGHRIVTSISDRLHHLSGQDGPPPWEKAAPSWVRPETS